MLALLSDPRAFNPVDYQDILHHLRRVTRDALERPWPAVRRWTQFVWDSIEAGSITWSDRATIQDERVRICLTSVYSNIPHQNNTYQIPARRNQGLQEVTCRPFNTRAGCPQRESHADGQVYSLHICTYCDSVGKVCYHSVRDCERRLAHTRNDNSSHHSRNRNYNYNPQNGNNIPFNHYQQGATKNGY